MLKRSWKSYHLLRTEENDNVFLAHEAKWKKLKLISFMISGTLNGKKIILEKFINVLLHALMNMKV